MNGRFQILRHRNVVKTDGSLDRDRSNLVGDPFGRGRIVRLLRRGLRADRGPAARLSPLAVGAPACLIFRLLSGERTILADRQLQPEFQDITYRSM